MIKIDIVKTGMVDTNELSVISYNCQYANELRLEFMEKLFRQCDFLFIQEHGLFKSKLSWFQILGKDVGVHGVSAMNEGQIIRGRPRGGAAIIWNGLLHHKVTPVPWDSTRMCAVTFDFAFMCLHALR